MDNYKKLIIDLIQGLPRLHLIAAASVSLLLMGLIIIPSNEDSQNPTEPSATPQEPKVAKARSIIDEASLTEKVIETSSAQPPESKKKEQAQPAAKSDNKENPQVARDIDTYTVKSGDTLATLFEKSGLNATDVYNFTRSHKKAKEMTRLQPGNKLILALNSDGKLTQARLSKTPLKSVIYTRASDSKKFKRTTETIEPEKRYVFREATIKGSLFGAGKKAGLSHQVTMHLANIFGWDIDFMLDIRKGDRFTLLFEEHYLNNKKIDDGPILAASFTNRGHTYKAVRYTNSKGHSHYYTPEGDSMRKEFLRTPVDFTRISSHFNLRRKHPVLNRIRAHKGTDYAAPYGTPIRSAGDGKVIFAGRKGGFGRTVIVQHGQKYQTLYAHVQKFHKKIRKGAKVKQGQTIAYVGSSGLATGPHLHYEFRVNGAVRNPMTVHLPKANPIPKEHLADFKRHSQTLLAQLEKGTTFASLPAKKIEG